MRLTSLVLALAVVLGAAPARAQDYPPTKLLRFPDIHGDAVVFTYGGDLWTRERAGRHGGAPDRPPGRRAVRASSRPTAAGSPSPGSTTATSRSTSSRPAGGEPRQLTFYPARGPLAPRWGYDNQVYGWTPDGTGRAVPLDHATPTAAAPRPRSTPCRSTGGLPATLPMPTAGRRRLLARRQAHRLLAAVPRLPHLEALPGRLGAGPLRLRPGEPRRSSRWRTACAPSATRCGSATPIYFVSDRDGTLNLYRYDLADEAASSQLTTRHDLGRALGRARDNRGQVVYELDGELEVLRHGEPARSASSPSTCPTTA